MSAFRHSARYEMGEMAKEIFRRIPNQDHLIKFKIVLTQAPGQRVGVHAENVLESAEDGTRQQKT